MRGRLGRRYDTACRVLVACLRGGMVLPAGQVAVLAEGQATERDRASLLLAMERAGLTAGGAECVDKGASTGLR